MSTLAVNTITNAAGGNTAQINGMTPTADSLQGFRNRIINGDMRIDQRNAGAAVTANPAFPVDRFAVGEDTAGAYSAQQDSSAPAGFVNSLKFTTTTADTSIAAADISFVRQFVEGTNVSDLAWGSANAKTVTLSFWVRSSLTGTFGGAIVNSAYNRSYPFTYTISVADTWEYKTVTIPGDTSGTWLTTTGIGLRIYWDMGTGTDNTGTADAWVGAGNVGVDGTVAVIGTLNATWYITGVQLEAGSVATPFERRPYGTELQLAMRYFETGTLWAAGANPSSSTASISVSSLFSTPKRVAPTVVSTDVNNANTTAGVSTTNITTSSIELETTTTSTGGGWRFARAFTASAEL